jgi:hypothetical protein
LFVVVVEAEVEVEAEAEGCVEVNGALFASMEDTFNLVGCLFAWECNKSLLLRDCDFEY